MTIIAQSALRRWVLCKFLRKDMRPGFLLELETAEHCFEVLRIDCIKITGGGF